MVKSFETEIPDRLRGLSAERLEEILAQYPWFDTVRLLLRQRTGKEGFLPDAWLQARPAPSFRRMAQPLSGEAAPNDSASQSPTLDTIERFLAAAPRRIVPEKNTGSPPVNLAKESVAEDPDLVSEELAEIFARQGLYSKAKAIYNKLSLLYPEKSVYFAQLIAGLDEAKKSERRENGKL